jgi:hypothetical protein
MVSVLASSAVDRGFEPRSGQTKDYSIGICCFSAKHSALRRKSAKTGWLGIRISDCILCIIYFDLNTAIELCDQHSHQIGII